MQAKLGSERVAVQNTLIRYAKPEEALSLRGGKTGLSWEDV